MQFGPRVANWLQSYRHDLYIATSHETSRTIYGPLVDRGANDNALSYHRTREAQAAGITIMYYAAGKMDPADILSKHWDLASAWDSLRPLLFWMGGTYQLLKEELLEKTSEANKATDKTTDNNAKEDTP